MMLKKCFFIFLVFVLGIFTYPKSAMAQLSNNPKARINNPLGFDPLNLHVGRGAMYVSLLTGAAYFINKKNKEVEDKRLSFYFESGTMWSYEFPYTLIPETNLGVNYKVLKWLGYGADVGIYNPRDEFNRSTGFSMLRIFNRFYFRDTNKFRLWLESGVGLVYFTKIFPVADPSDSDVGTNWNGVVKYGLAAEYNINQCMSVLLGVRHLHFSNAEVFGKDRNPSSDSHGIFLGVNYNPRLDLNRQQKVN